MDLGIRGRLALVTGASAGLGRACALSLAAEGAVVAVAARRQAELDAVAADAKEAGAADAAGFTVDLADAASIERMLAAVRERFGRPVEILIANSGGPKPGTFTQLQPEDWERGFNGVLRSIITLTGGVVPAMREAKWGRIVTLTSTSVKQPIPTLALSNAFRTAVVAAMKTLSTEVAHDGVTVNCIATGRIATARLRSLYQTKEEWSQAEQEIPARHIATPEEFAPLVTFLASVPASYVTGQTIAVDGGLVGSVM